VIVTPLSDRGTAAVREVLLSHGWEGDLALLAAGGLATGGFHVTGLATNTIEAMLSVAGRLGLELVTGDDWIILAGARSRLGAFARPWLQPEPVQELAMAIGMALPAEAPRAWRHARGTLSLDGPVVVGVLNVTPDSFSDGGQTRTVAEALAHVVELVDGGAAVVDVGSESTRPGAAPLDPAEELTRGLPVIEAIVREYPALVLSVDTVRSETARAALDAGVAIVNDVTAGRHDPALLAVAAANDAGVVLSHSRGALGRLASYDAAEYGADVVGVVAGEVAAAVANAGAAGVAADAIVIDPGFGFGKRPEQNFRLLAGLDAFVAMGKPVLVGVSRKRFLGEVTGRGLDDRDRATAAACALAYSRGARLFRVHNPEAVRDALKVAAAVERASA
jgi:dihydropteroate synthase